MKKLQAILVILSSWTLLALVGCTPAETTAPDAAQPATEVAAPAAAPAAEPAKLGQLPADAIRKVIKEKIAEVKGCYEAELATTKGLEGRIVMHWMIAKDGSVATVAVKETTMKNAKVEGCIGDKVKTWKFPAPTGDGQVEVNYPFVFKAGNVE